jgi:peptidoglycan/xylan/chitin deacetylase (PgdA/CDA1 family)
MDRRRFIARTGLLTAGGAAGAAAGWAAEQVLTREGPTARTARPPGPAPYVATATFRTQPSAKLIALTIDDGPTREWSPQVLNILRRHGAKATFFRVGEQMQAAPDLVVQTADAGHEQGNHTWAHSDLTQHDERFDRDSLERTQELLAKLTGQVPALCRPPYGRIDSVGLAVCASLRYGVTLWSHGITGINAQYDVDEILQQVSPGSIVLLHDGGPQPNASLMKQLDRLTGSLTNDGYRFVTVSELLAASAPVSADGAPARSQNSGPEPEPARNR